MSLLTRSTSDTGTGTETTATAPLRSPVAVGALAAAQAVAGSLLCVLLPVVATWMLSARTGATWSESLRIGADAWLLAHHTGIAVDGGHLALVPLGLSLVPAAWCWAAGTRMAAATGLANGTAPRRRTSRRLLGSFTGIYALLCAVVSLLAASPVARPLSGQALVGGAVLSLVFAGCAVLHASRSPVYPSVAGAFARALHLRRWMRDAAGAGAVALAVWTGAAALLLAVAMVVGWEGIGAAHSALEPDGMGGAALVVGQLLVLPVLVVWAGSWVAGPGFAVGTGTSVTPAATDLGPVPAVPVLGALPPGGPLPLWVGAVIGVPVVAGALAAWWLHRRRSGATGASGGVDDAWRLLVRDAGATGAVAGAVAGVLGWLASGPVGPGRMAVVGPHPWLLAVALAAEVAAGCLIGLVLLRGRRQEGQPKEGPDAGT